MQLNEGRFRQVCRGAQVHIARHLGIHANTLCIKLKDPANKLSVAEFLSICGFLNYPPADFIINAE